ncbi:MAG: hypothetical protein ACK4XJ_08685 [Fimbriimonadaceae bacterium]
MDSGVENQFENEVFAYGGFENLLKNVVHHRFEQTPMGHATIPKTTAAARVIKLPAQL